MQDLLKLKDFATADVKVSGEESTGSRVSPVIGEPGFYEGYLEDIQATVSKGGDKVLIKFNFETDPVDGIKPVATSVRGGQVATVQMGIYFNPSDATSKQTIEFYKNLGIIAKKAGKFSEFEQIKKGNFYDFMTSFLKLMKDVKLAYAFGGDKYLAADKNDASKVYVRHALKFTRYGFVKNTLAEYEGAEINENDIKEIDPEAKPDLYAIYSGNAPKASDSDEGIEDLF